MQIIIVVKEFAWEWVSGKKIQITSNWACVFSLFSQLKRQFRISERSSVRYSTETCLIRVPNAHQQSSKLFLTAIANVCAVHKCLLQKRYRFNRNWVHILRHRSTSLHFIPINIVYQYLFWCYRIFWFMPAMQKYALESGREREKKERARKTKTQEAVQRREREYEGVLKSSEDHAYEAGRER